VMRFLEERGVGFDTQLRRVPIVPAAALFDLWVGDPDARPGPENGYEACVAASDQVPEGNVGAGTGATVAKLAGPGGAVKAGIGTASRQDGELVVGDVAAVNAVGEVLDENGEVLARSRLDLSGEPEAGTNTTLVVVATNARLTRERAHLLAQASHEGLTGAIRPAHTLRDGDTVFSLATGQVGADQRRVEALAVEAVMESIRRGVLTAESIPGVPAVGDRAP